MGKHWYNDFGTLVGDVGQILTGHNPNNNPPPVSAPVPKGPTTLPVAGGPASTGQTTSTYGTDPTDPTYDNGGNTYDYPSDPSSGSGGSFAGAVVGGLESAGSAILDFLKNYGGDIASGIADFAKKYGTTALEAWNIYNAAQRQAQADQYGKDALASAQSAYDAKSGLRSSGIAGLMNPGATVPDLSSLKNLAGAQSGNPFARGGALPVAGGQGRPISAGPVNNTPTPSVPSGPIGTQTLFGGTLPVANAAGGIAQQVQGIANGIVNSKAPTLPVAQTPQTPALQKPTLPTLPLAPTDRAQGQY